MTSSVPEPSALAALDRALIARALDAHGFALLPRLLTRLDCDALVRCYDDASLFRSQVVMARHGYGRGEYKYFAYPLPPSLAELRAALYAALVPIANRWYETMKLEPSFPATHQAFLARCHERGQLRPTPLLLRYGPGDYNCLHQDRYGDQLFPLQVAVLLCEPAEDFTGGELILTEQRPRAQSRASVVALSRGDAVVFAVNQRPVTGARGSHRVTMRHGVSTLHSGRRHTLGIIFHDAT